MEFMFSSFDILAVIVLVIFFAGGLISGFYSKFSRFVAVVGAITITYFLAGTIAGAICSIESVNEWINSFEMGGIIILVSTYLVLFLVFLVLLMLFLKPIEKLLTGGPIRQTINKILGGVIGLATGFFVCSLYLLLTYFIAKNNVDVNSRFQSELGYESGVMTLSRFILDFAMRAVGIN